jgi:ribosomal protein L19E
MSREYSIHEYNIMCNLDRLRQLIKNCKEDGKFTKAKTYQDYYDELRTRPKIKELIKETVHEIPTEQKDSSRINTSTE